MSIKNAGLQVNCAALPSRDPNAKHLPSPKISADKRSIPSIVSTNNLEIAIRSSYNTVEMAFVVARHA